MQKLDSNEDLATNLLKKSKLDFITSNLELNSITNPKDITHNSMFKESNSSGIKEKTLKRNKSTLIGGNDSLTRNSTVLIGGNTSENYTRKATEFIPFKLNNRNSISNTNMSINVETTSLPLAKKEVLNDTSSGVPKIEYPGNYSKLNFEFIQTPKLREIYDNFKDLKNQNRTHVYIYIYLYIQIS